MNNTPSIDTPQYLSRFPLEKSWVEAIGKEFEKSYMKELGEFLQGEIHAGKTIYPPQEDLLLAFRTRLDKVKVVIIGQDPYHGPNQAHGLAFSVKKGVKIPPSLRNIYKEVNSDLGLSTPQSGNLESWADQGVLLLNSVLSVEQGKPNSHAGKGWEIFTDLVVKAVNNQTNPVVFMLWGAYAQKKGASIHLPDMVIKSPHPSPFSAHTGFLGSRPFSRANVFLQANGRDPINWSIPIS